MSIRVFFSLHLIFFFFFLHKKSTHKQQTLCTQSGQRKNKNRSMKTNKPIPLNMNKKKAAWTANWCEMRPEQAQMEQVCCRTGNYANNIYYSKNDKTPEQLSEHKWSWINTSVKLNNYVNMSVIIWVTCQTVSVLNKFRLNKKGKNKMN